MVQTFYKTERFHMSVHVFIDNAWRTSKCDKNISHTTRLLLVAFFFVPARFWHIPCLIRAHTHTHAPKWNLFVKLQKCFISFCERWENQEVGYLEPRNDSVGSLHWNSSIVWSMPSKHGIQWLCFCRYADSWNTGGPCIIEQKDLWLPSFPC